CADGSDEVRSQLSTATDQLATAPDLVIWGEGVLTGPTPKAAGAKLTALGPLQAPLLVGITSPAADGEFFNRNVLLDRDGEVLGAYTKRQPVPFGEYVPARDRLGRLHEVGRLVPNDMRRGTIKDPLPLGEVQLGTVSSWEVTFSRLVRDVAPDSHVLATLTTQATYGRSSVSDQLLRAAELRAAEHQRSVIVAATTGRSAVIRPDGTRGPMTALYAADALTASVELRHGRTPFSRVGDLPVALSALVAVLLGRRKAAPQG
ncbi:MAG: apolipoprotein N-acyltransferase, partial [Dehalococcoidia bacterium]